MTNPHVSSAAAVARSIKKTLEAFDGAAELAETGHVLEVGDGIARVSGLRQAEAMEMLDFESGAVGVALNLEQDRVGVILLSGLDTVRAGDQVRRTGQLLSVPVGPALVGRVVDPLGRPLDGMGAITTHERFPVERVAPGVMTREPVTVPLMTGIKAVDAMIPIGRGQRELIIGDRQTGKTAIAVDTIVNQRDKKVWCVYVAIGQKASKVARLVAKLREAGAMDYTIIVAAEASAPASLQFIAPYAGCAMAEYFMSKGEDALIVYDDLSKHAWSYREVSLLLRRPPGREAYPGDVFYLHSRLLERAARLNKENGGGSLTALPIIETQAGDVSAYIPTNVISITDGQIYLESDLFYRGVRPALNVGLSVSRVGGAAQTKAMKKVAGQLRLDLAQFRELEAFAQFATDVDAVTKRQIERGRRTVEILKQGQFVPLAMAFQIATLYAVTRGHADTIEVEQLRAWEEGLHRHLTQKESALLEELHLGKALDADAEQKLKKAIEDWHTLFLA